MRTLSSFTDYEHSNIYVHKQKLLLSIKDMQTLLTQQYKTKVVEIPPYILRDEIKTARRKLKEINYKIACIEQLAFNFGLNP